MLKKTNKTFRYLLLCALFAGPFIFQVKGVQFKWVKDLGEGESQLSFMSWVETEKKKRFFIITRHLMVVITF